MIAIVTACGANFASVQFALERLGRASVLTTDAEVIQKASAVILPGVGTAQHAMQQLQKLDLITVLKNLQQPVLGICLGMQILHEYSAEGEVACLGILPGQVLPLAKKAGYSLPHMGWNQINFSKAHPLLSGVAPESHVYFVHSYRVGINENTIATTSHSEAFAAIVQYQNFYGIQFHPERSGQVGAKILENFFNMK